MSYNNGPKLATDNPIQFYLDAGNSKSYPGTGTVWNDLSINGNNGTLTNGPTYSSANGGSIVFDGVNDYVTTSNTNLAASFTGDMTAEVWFKISATSSDWVRVIGTGGNTGNRTFGLWYNNPGNYLLWQRYGGPADPSILITSALSLNTWYYFAATTSGTAHALYLNNSKIGTATASGPWTASSENITLGYAGFHAYINGNIALGRLYGKGLTSSEILQNYNANRGRFGL